MLFGNGTNADVVDERNYETRRPWDMGVHLMRFLQENEKRYLMLIGRPGGIKKIKLNELRLRPCVDSNIIQHFFSCWTWPHLGLPSPRFNFKNKKVKNRFYTHTRCPEAATIPFEYVSSSHHQYPSVAFPLRAPSDPILMNLNKRD